MKIVYEIERLSTNGGIEHILTDRMNYMADVWGWDITIITLLEKDTLPHYALSSNVSVIGLGIKSSGLLMCTKALWKLNKVIKQLNPDIYVTFQTIGALSCLFRTHNVKTIYEMHGARKYAYHPLATYTAEMFANAVTVLTSEQKKDFPRAKRVEIIPNFTLINARGIPDYGSKTIVAAGRKSYQKNFKRLKYLWERVAPRHKEWTLKIHHDTKDMATAYIEGSLFVMTSRFEGFPMVLIESMRCGLPVIAFDCPYGPSTIIEDGKNGFLIPYDDDDLFVEKLTYLMENPQARQQMGEYAKMSAERFSQEHVMPIWKNFYESIV